MLAMEGSNAQKTPELIKRTTKSPGRHGTLEPPHRSIAVLNPAMILLKSVVQVYVRPMPNRFAQFAPDRRRIGIMTVGRDPVRRNPGHVPGRTEELFGGREIAALAEHHVDQVAVAVDGPV